MRKALLAGGCVVLLFIVGSIARSLLSTRVPTCDDCGGRLVQTMHRDDQYMTATEWKCEQCGRFTVEHVHKDTGDGRYFDRQ